MEACEIRFRSRSVQITANLLYLAGDVGGEVKTGVLCLLIMIHPRHQTLHVTWFESGVLPGIELYFFSNLP